MNEASRESEDAAGRPGAGDDRVGDRLYAIDAEARRIWIAKILGRPIGPFDVLERIDADDTGATFKAVDKQKDRVVRLKVLWLKIASDETAFARFVRAMRTMIGAEHPNLIRLFAAGREEDFCYMASELLDARTLHRVMKDAAKDSGRVDWKFGLDVARDITCALEFAFQNKILHRNINPRNILITSAGTAKLDNLILAKAIEGVKVEQITQDSMEIIGEMTYLAPEVLLSDEGLNCQSDIYSLGATLYHALAGRAPFEASSAADLGRMILAATPQSLTVLRPDLPNPFGAVVMRMLARDLAVRYSTPSQLADDLAKIER